MQDGQAWSPGLAPRGELAALVATWGPVPPGPPPGCLGHALQSKQTPEAPAW